MTDLDFRDLLATLDRSARPDPGFVDALEDRLVEAVCREPRTVNRSLLVAAVVAFVVVAIGAAAWLGANIRVGPDPAPVVDSMTSVGGTLHPAPLFDTAPLGPEAGWQPVDPLSDSEQTELAGTFDAVAGEPVVRIGTVTGVDLRVYLVLVDVEAGDMDGLMTRSGRFWCVWMVGGEDTNNGHCLDGVTGPVDATTTALMVGDGWRLYAGIPDDVAVVAAVDDAGQYLAWQRPVNGIALLPLDPVDVVTFDAYGVPLLSETGARWEMADPMPDGAEAVSAEDLMSVELASIAERQSGDLFYRIPADRDANQWGWVRVRLDRSTPPLLFGTSCDVVQSIPLPTRWRGACLERTLDGERQFGPWFYGRGMLYGGWTDDGWSGEPRTVTNPEQPSDDNPTVTTATSPDTTRVEPTSQEAPGWTFAEIPFTIREGSAYAVGGGWFFAWGGAPDRSGQLKSDGVLVDISTGVWADVPEAPIGGRYTSAAVWTGQEFVVFGGHSFSQSFVDGAAFDPTTQTWRRIGEAPLTPAAFPSAVWTGSEMMVWLAGVDSEPAESPAPAVGQMAAYDPAIDRWRMVQAPDVQVRDATLLSSGIGVTFVGGPTTRDLGTGAGASTVVVTTLDPGTRTWSQPVEGPEAEAVRPFTLPGETIGLLTDNGVVNVLDRDGQWRTTAHVQDCWHDIGAASAGETVYLKSCATYQLDADQASQILGAGAYGATSNLYAAGFLVTEEGDLVTLTDAASSGGVIGTGTAIFGVHDSNQ